MGGVKARRRPGFVIGRPSEERAAAHGARAAYHFVQPNAAQLTEIGGLLDLGKIEPVIEAVLPLSEARQAQEVSQEGHVRGKSSWRWYDDDFMVEERAQHWGAWQAPAPFPCLPHEPQLKV